MPNTHVPVAAEGMPKFDRAQIMRDAWSIYRRRWAGARLIKAAARRKEFGNALRNAWAWAKEATSAVLATAAEKAADRVRDLTAELMRIDARPWGMRSHRSEATRAFIISQIQTA